MTMQRRPHSGEFKAKVVLEALRGERTLNEIAGVHLDQYAGVLRCLKPATSSILVAVALQRWDTPNPHALAARDAAAGLTKGAGARLSVLSVYG